MASQIEVEFGYCPEALTLNTSQIKIAALPNLKETVVLVSNSPEVERDWIYTQAPPSATRVFGLPKTHTFKHGAADGPDHVNFHVWVLSFFLGLRLTTTQAGFVDATPIKPGKLTDFHLGNKGLEKTLDITEHFWQTHRAHPERAKVYSAAVHALFIAQYPRALQFEQFMFLYASLDACFALTSSLHPSRGRTTHAARIEWMCGVFGMPVPGWASTAHSSHSQLSVIRNAAVHEAIFMGEPLGFAVHGVGTDENITLEMEALICRLLVALIGADTADYVRTPVTTRQTHGLDL